MDRKWRLAIGTAAALYLVFSLLLLGGSIAEIRLRTELFQIWFEVSSFIRLGLEVVLVVLLSRGIVLHEVRRQVREMREEIRQ